MVPVGVLKREGESRTDLLVLQYGHGGKKDIALFRTNIFGLIGLLFEKIMIKISLYNFYKYIDLFYWSSWW